MVFNRGQIASVYDEIERRISIMIYDGEIETEKELNDIKVLMRQGAYATLMATATNWEEIVQWIDEIER